MQYKLNYWISCIFFLTVATSEDINYRLPEHVRPIHYNISIDTFLNNLTFEGTVQIQISVISVTNRIVLHSKDLTIKSVAIPNVHVTTTADMGTEFLTLLLDRNLPAGSIYTVYIQYRGSLSSEPVGYYRAQFRNQQNQMMDMAVTHLEPTNARRAFPCFDQPDFKATFRIHLTRPSGFVSTSNMNRLGDPVNIGNGRFRDEYNTSVPMSTYLVAFMVSQYEPIATISQGITYRTFGRFHLIARGDGNYSLDVAPKAVQEMEAFTRLQYPLVTLDNVPVPNDYYKIGAMENWGMITYREKYLMHNNLSTASETQFTATLITHEIAHQWFGNLVTPKWWDYIWLNEGFASYFELFITSQFEPSWKLMEQFTTSIMQYAFEDDSLESSKPMVRNVQTPDEIGEIYDTITYEKAASVIRMAANFLGDTPFRNGLMTYLQINKYQNVNSTHLYSSWQSAIGGTPATATNITRIMQSWETQIGYPVVTVTRLPNGTLILNQQRFLQYKTKHNDRTVWHIPLNWLTQTTTTNAITWFYKQNAMLNLNINPEQWFIMNVNRTGFYRVNYDEANWRRIISHLKTGIFSPIAVINRAQLVDDAFSLARSLRLNYSIALDLGSYIVNETEYVPIASFTNAYSHLYRLAVGQPHFNMTEEYGRRILEAYFNRTNFIQQNDPHLIKLTKVTVLTWLCRLNHQACRTESNRAFNAWMNGGTPIQPDSQGFVLCNGIRASSNLVWNTVLERYRLSEATEGTRIAQGLGCSSDQLTLRRLLDMVIDQNSVFSTSDRVPIVTSVYTNNGLHGVSIVLQWLLDNFSVIDERVGGTSSIITGVAYRITTNNQQSLFSRFVNETGANFTASLNMTIKDASRIVVNNMEWINNTSIVFENHFSNNGGNIIYLSGLLMLISIFLQRRCT